MRKENKIGTTYEFCSTCASCPVAVEAKIDGKTGLEVRDDFGGSVKLTDQNLEDFKKLLDERFM